MLATPLVTIGALGAILVWEIEHVDSAPAAVLIAVGAIGAAVVVAAGLRARIVKVSEHYESLLATADEQSQRAEAASRVKDEFLATLSHELRTPLNSVLGWTRLLSTGKLNAAQTARAVAAIERAGWAQTHLIENLLDVSRMVEGKLAIVKRPTVVQPLVEAVVDSLRPGADLKRISLDIHLDPTLGPITVDPNRFHQIVWHLLSNAIKFTPADGRIAVKIERSGEMMRLVVRDSGVGFAPETAEQLFEQFKQGETGTTRQYGGLGLGLAIVRNLVEQHGGTVGAASAGPNHGAEFEVLLPLHTLDDVRGPDPGAPVEPAPLLRGLSILVVDDNPEDREFVRTSLEQFGAIVRTAASAHEASESFRREHPDVIVSDLVMPDADGLQLIREIRKMEQRIGGVTPAAALSALARADDRRRALSAGYQMHVAKPIDPFELASTVERLAALKRTERPHA
jgi:signal transduction histidine kinase/ActR/RegA family two-component response regulator